MTWVIPPLVTEHEDAHYWPNGAYDGPADEDCVFVSGLMQYLAWKPRAAAATLYEAERIRQAAGLGPDGGALTSDLLRGESIRYGWKPATAVGFAALWAGLTPGHGATASGVPTDTDRDSPFRHWLPYYTGGHRVFVERLDSQDRVWLMDPEAMSGYGGEWATKSDLEAFTRHGSTHTVAPLALGFTGSTGGIDLMGLPVTLPAVGVAGTLSIPSGTDAIRVSDATHYKLPVSATRPAYVAALTGAASESGYLVDLNGDEMHFIRKSAAGLAFTVTPPPLAITLRPGIYEVTA